MPDATAAQRDYEAALGRFLVCFNALEGELNEVIEMALDEAGYPALAKEMISNSFRRRVQLLQTLAKDNPRLENDVHDRLVAIAQRRNSLAHATILNFGGKLRVASTNRDATSPLEIEKLALEATALAQSVSILWLRLQDL